MDQESNPEQSIQPQAEVVTQTEPETEPHTIPPPTKKKKATLRNFNVVRFEKRLTATFSIVIRLLLLFLIAVGLVFIYKELSNPNYSIQRISVPASFEEAGYTGPVIANRIFNELNSVINNERLKDITAEYKNANSIVDLNVDLVGIGVPIRSFTGLLGEALGINNKKQITADIVLDGDTVVLEMKIVDETERQKILIKGGLEATLKQLTKKASESILKHSNPYVLARQYLRRDSEGCFNLGKYLLDKHEGNPDIEPIGYFAWGGGFLTEGKFELGEMKIREGLKKYAQDLNLNAALGTILRMQGKFDMALAQDKKTVQMVNANTPINRVARSYLNIGYDFDQNTELGVMRFDSAIFYVNKALVIDKHFPEAYLTLCDLNLHKQDTLKAFHYLEQAMLNGLNVGNYSYYDIFKLRNDYRMKKLLDSYSVK